MTAANLLIGMLVAVVGWEMLRLHMLLRRLQTFIETLETALSDKDQVKP